ncbi:restriction endonuclease subunit S [Salinispora arenicola]|uniref:restriction endonuclease subunit S n=1 Tax=Salinispora arenicola TaxID=168697 RepID=UPI001692EC0B|nr:restriction endonuclease subunit S [Salinispora arenicola]NIL55782.1 restriction endonuclease subunit S [Salinispora arenicola]NIL61103.1 restriction endonuclease subunit S [Salinispora arenicola]
MTQPWPVSTVGEQFEVHLGKMLDSAKNVGFPKPYVGNRAVQWGWIDLSAVGVAPLTQSDIRRFRLRNGDLLVCEGGEIGRGAIWRDQLSECYYQKALHRLRPKNAYDVRLMLALLEYWSTGGVFPNYVTQTSIAHLPRDKFIEMPLPLPSAAEQARIGEVIQDVNDLIHALRRMIAKKQAIRQGLRQQLLTGRTRLPGYSGSWREVSLGRYVSYVNTVALSRAQLDGESPVRYVHYGDIHARDSPMLDAAREALPRASSTLLRNAGRLKVGDLVFADVSEDPDGVGKSVEVTSVPDVGVVPGLHTIAARFEKAVLADGFKAYLQFIPSFRETLHRLVVGTKVLATTRSLISSITLTLPNVDEQRAIASVLTDADREIAVLRIRLAKARDVKQGMMQELLAGRTRLPGTGSTA